MLPVVYHPAYSAALPAGHRFPMNKFRALYEHLCSTGAVVPAQVHRPQPARAGLLCIAHDECYVQGVLQGSLGERSVRRIGFPLTESVIARSAAAVAGTLLAARLALSVGIAANTAGGSHHAFSAHGSGYCVFNDVAVAARALLAAGDVRRILVVDLDVHQGDGTASICAGDPAIFTFSMHGARNFPHIKQVSDRDVALPDGTTDEHYLARLDRELRSLLRLRPDLVFYNAGVDPHEDDRLGRLSLSLEGLRRRDRMVLRAAREAGAAVVGVLGGGYSEDPHQLVRLHALLFQEASLALG